MTIEFSFPDIIGSDGVFTDGDWVESKDQDPNGDIRLVQLADIGIGKFIDKSKRNMTSEAAAKLKCTMLQPGDILIARMPDPIGRACIFPGDEKPCVTVVDVCVLRPDLEIADSNWLVHFINSSACYRQIDKWVTGTTRQRISRGNLSKVIIPLPPLEEQKRIAAILDKADAIRRKRQQAIELADQFLRSVFLDMFGDPVTNPKGWSSKKLVEVAELVNGDRSSNYPSGTDLVDSGIIFLSTANITDNNLDLKKKTFITAEKFASLGRGKLQPNDLIITLRGTLASCCIFDCEHDTGFINAQMMIIRSTNISLEYLHALLSFPTITKYLKGIASGSAVPQLTAKQLESLVVMMPPEDLRLKYIELRMHLRTKLNEKYRFFTNTDLFSSLSKQLLEG